MGIGIEKDHKFIIGDKGEFEKLPPIFIKEDIFTHVFAHSEISVCVPEGITWDTDSLLLFSGDTLLEYDDYDFDNDCIELRNLPVNLDETVIFDGVYLNELSTEMDSSINYTIHYLILDETFNRQDKNGIYVVKPKVKTGNYDFQIALDSVSVDIIQLVEDETPVFDEKRSLILLLEGELSEYLYFLKRVLLLMNLLILCT